MTIRCTVQVEIGPLGGEGRQAVAAVIDHPDELAPETLGVTLAEAHALLRETCRAGSSPRRSTSGRPRTAPVLRAEALAG